ncbi:tRNA (uracil-5-)-methyltransferase A [Amphibalanus amphitrite]|uniref:tRNA (uracil(54)-C(5))-methyltransferase n=1 Tax=Amphibalanus amphitrite TaxID=1232801 RepID=A0A6A4XCC5_AMPAM|nr:tRNA (uracil-5-)-methyltransferase A [Amphibalanus amphitrite]KAF0313981.1 tRNA (uracil-5-)-methyltransferase A [Amphibalanus amphitrite]
MSPTKGDEECMAQNQESKQSSAKETQSQSEEKMDTSLSLKLEANESNTNLKDTESGNGSTSVEPINSDVNNGNHSKDNDQPTSSAAAESSADSGEPVAVSADATGVATDAKLASATESPAGGAGAPPEAATDTLTPYSYTSRGEFTSENFKIEIRNMPRYYGVAQFKKFLTNTLKLNVHKLKPLPGRGAGIFVTLHDEATRQEALKLLDGREWKKAKLSARPAAAIPDPLLAHRQKRNRDDADGAASAEKKPRQEVPLSQRTRDAVVPWWNVPYDEQLQRKRSHVWGVLAEYKRTLRKQNFSLFKWMDKRENTVTVEPVRPSPETECYRNKCEFSVGFHPDTGERVVGFRLAAYRDGSMAVAPLDDLPHVSERMRKAAGLFQRHVRESKYAPFNALTHKGHWRQLLVRTTRGGDLLLSAQFHPQQLTDQEIAAAQEELRVFMADGPGAEAGVTSLLWQTAGRLESGQERPHQLLSGSPHITETLCGLQLRISPDAFFQVNTAAAEVLYDAVGECAELDSNTALLDVCCGTGSIGLALASRARAVLGLELVESAVADAKRNAEANGITNSQFWAGRAEALLRVLLDQAGEGRAVAVVDPPRAGLGREVTQTLRRTEGLKRVVYVACDIKQAMKNLLDLARPESNQYVGYPFVLRRLVPVDLFPQTPHIEVVAVLERCDPDLWRQQGEAEVSKAADRGQQEAGDGDAAKEGDGGGEKGNGETDSGNVEMKETETSSKTEAAETKGPESEAKENSEEAAKSA